MLAKIPLSKAMQVEFKTLTSDCVEMMAPLEPNKNHQGTAFGGSLYSVAALTAWSLVEKSLEGIDVGYLVIQDSQVKYLKPVIGDFRSQVEWSSSKAKSEFIKTLEKKGLARASLEVKINCADQLCMTMNCRFVASKSKTV